MNGHTPFFEAESETTEARIYVDDSANVQRWTSKFGCSREDLVYAVNKIGTSAEKVEAYLKRRQAAGFSKW